MSSYIIAGSADSLDTAYVLFFVPSARKLLDVSKPNTKILISGLSSNMPLNGKITFKKFAEFMVFLKNQIQLFIRSMAKSSEEKKISY